ncbi:DUF3533 domain-containing protein [Niallia oryzisoli]|uniref:DUF3533 domain-containing protein n=1 Tax=Niallia oryzisoli TaxID=1737571 RepID=A0ABZ2CNR5_9BACI
MGRFFKNKMLWIGLGINILVASIFTFAFMGSMVNPTPKELPIAVVVEDEGAKLPNGENFNLGATFAKEIQKRDTSSVKWKILKTKVAALEAMNEKEVYAAIVLPRDLSKNIFSLLTINPTKPSTTIIINEGMNLGGANLALQIANSVLITFNQQIEAQLYTQIAEMKVPISLDMAKIISNPVSVETEKINPVGSNSANGNTPALFTQILWMATFISSMILFTLLKKGTEGSWTLKSFASQIIAGVLYVVFISGVIFLLTIRVLEVSVSNEGELFIMLVFIGLCFFFIQNTLLNWIGYPAAPLIILLFFFSTPILTMAPELLPNVTRDYLYTWVPFRFSLESFMDLLFFDKGLFENGIGTIGVIGLISLCLMGFAILKPVKKRHVGASEKM